MAGRAPQKGGRPIPRKSNRSQPYYSPAIRSACQCEYESGAYSVESLPTRKKYGIATRTIEKWVAKYAWAKGAAANEIEQLTREKTLDAFARLGCPRDTVIQRTIEGIHAGADVVDKIMQMASANVADKGTPITLELIEALKGIGVNLGVRAKFIDLYCKMCGEYAPSASEVHVTERGGEPTEPPPDLSGFTSEELRTYIKLRDKARRTRDAGADQ